MNTRFLKTYNAPQQHWGTFLSGYDWDIYGCGTYREPVSEPAAEALMKRFMEKLGKKLRTPVSFFAVLERRYSGCGMPPTPLHWHFLATSTYSQSFADIAQNLWA